MPTIKKLAVLPRPEIEAELREFIDDVLVPMLVADALREIQEENRLAPALAAVAQSPRSQEIQ
jgi:hypothetical protein